MFSYVVMMCMECLIKKRLVQICFVDILLKGLVKLRVFNGYMSDDRDLEAFVGLQGYSKELSRHFKRGVEEAEKFHFTMGPQTRTSGSISSVSLPKEANMKR